MSAADTIHDLSLAAAPPAVNAQEMAVAIESAVAAAVAATKEEAARFWRLLSSSAIRRAASVSS